MEMSPCDLRRLAEMLQPSEAKEKEDTSKGPDNFNDHCSEVHDQGEDKSNDKALQEKTEDEDDERLRPEVNFAYSQQVRSEDIFLGMGFRTPGSASCENLRVTVLMPEEETGTGEIDAQVDCSRNCLEVRSPRYRLSLPLPHPVDPSTSAHRAQWDVQKRELVVNVKLKRELDFVNF